MGEQKYTGPERRASHLSEVREIKKQLLDGRVRMDSLEGLIATNTRLTEETQASVAQLVTNTAGFVSFSQDLVAGTRFMCRCARGLTWFAQTVRENWVLAVLAVGIYAFTTHNTALLDLLMKFLKA